VNDDGAARDLGIHDRALPDDQRVLRRDLSVHVTFDADGALELQLARHMASLAEKRARTARLSGLNSLPLEHLRLPGCRTARGDAGFRGEPPGPVEPLAFLAK